MQNLKSKVTKTLLIIWIQSSFLNSEAKILAYIDFLAGIEFVEAYRFKTAQNLILDSCDENQCLVIM